MMDPSQVAACQAAGIPVPQPKAISSPRMVAPLVAVECESCGCTNAWPEDARRKVCAAAEQIEHELRQHQHTRDRFARAWRRIDSAVKGETPVGAS